MIVVDAYRDQKVGVFGLGRSGLAACKSLHEGGASVLAWDDNEAQREAQQEILGSETHDLNAASFDEMAALVVAPGVPLTHPEPHTLVKKAQEADVPVIGDIELFAKARPDLPAHKLAAVTGTNGKSTTTALLAHVLNADNIKAIGGGNIGIPVLGIEPLEEDGVYVFELSSFQLELTFSLKPEIAILLNISPDHLDRHGDMTNYVAAKRRIFEMQTGEGVGIIGVDDPYGELMATTFGQKIIPVSCEKPVTGGVYVIDGELFDATEGAAKNMGKLGTNRALRGKHNGQNAAAVYAAAKELGAKPDHILASFESFEGLPHRLEIVGEKDGVTFINDSKASNTGSALRSLEAFENIYWIAGGLFKEDTLEMFEPVLGRVQKAYLIGEDDSVFVKFLEDKVPFARSGTLDVAIAAAAKDAKDDAKDGSVVLLAPACASFDQFKNFEDRGETFRAAAEKILAKNESLAKNKSNGGAP